MRGSHRYERVEKTDPLNRDNKRLPLSGPEVYPTFIFYLVVVIPLWLLVMCPFAILVRIFNHCGIWIRSAFARKREIRKDKVDILMNQPNKSTSSKKFDIVIFDAFGFTGALACLYTARQYGNKINWAMAGCDQEGLEVVRRELGPEFANIPLIPVSMADLSILDAAVASAKVIICTERPNHDYGTLIVASCVKSGTHYCDVNGDFAWLREIIDRFDTFAQQSGSCVVCCCGHDCIPWDLSVLALSKQLSKKGDMLREIRCYDEFRGRIPGGTLATVFQSQKTSRTWKSSLGFDPLLKTCTGEKSTSTFNSKIQSLLKYSPEFQRWIGPLIKAPIMANCIRRSNALLRYSAELTYYEAVAYPNFMAAFIGSVKMLTLGTVLFVPELRLVVRALGLASSVRSDPTASDLVQGFLKVTAIGVGSTSTARSTFYFPADPGYRETARMVVESGLLLALQGPRVTPGGGVYTPAACLGEALLDRLVATGSSFTIETLPSTIGDLHHPDPAERRPGVPRPTRPRAIASSESTKDS